MLFRLLLALVAAFAALPAQMLPPDLAGAGGGSISDKVAWLVKNAVALRSIDPHDEDFADFEPLKKSIGDARIVLLGETWTKDGAAVKAKQRLVRFLHEEMGFDVLAAGASVFDGEEMDRALDGPSAPGADLRRGNTQLQAFRGGREGPVPPAEVLDYARATRKTGRPLHISGLGFQVSPFLQKEYAKTLFQFIDRIDPSLCPAGDRKAIKSMLDWTRPAGRGIVLAPQLGPSIGERTQWQDAIPKLYDNLGRLPAGTADAREIAFFRLTLANLAVWNGARGSPDAPLASQVRELANFVWLAKEWRPGSKIMVWSDNTSVLRNWQEETRTPPGLRPGTIALGARELSVLGRGVAQEFGAAAYVIGFMVVGGDAQINQILRAGPTPSLELADDSLEGLFHGAGKRYAFLDFRSLPPDHWLRQPMPARLWAGVSRVSTWPLSFDAVLCIDPRAAKARK